MSAIRSRTTSVMFAQLDAHDVRDLVTIALGRLQRCPDGVHALRDICGILLHQRPFNRVGLVVLSLPLHVGFPALTTFLERLNPQFGRCCQSTARSYPYSMSLTRVSLVRP
jgi:hypothetical protein